MAAEVKDAGSDGVIKAFENAGGPANGKKGKGKNYLCDLSIERMYP